MKAFIIILILAILGVVIWYWVSDASIDSAYNNEKATVCTMDAKLCSDGTYVGRVPPNCEFAVCPVSTSTDVDLDVNINAS